MERSYWARARSSRINRRGFLGYGVGGAATAAFLAACGSDRQEDRNGTADDGSGAPSDGLVAQPEDTYDRAVRGGTLREYVAAESQTLDPITPVAPLNPLARFVYGTLVHEAPGHMALPDGSLSGDMAESWEVSPDGLEISLKLRPGVKWHNKAPVNGREADIDDVLSSWQRYTELSPFRDLAYNGANPDAPIISLTATDSSTLLVQLQEPLSYALNYFGGFGSHSGNVIMVPKETDGAVDLRHEMIGHGPFELTNVSPSVGYTFRRHAEYYDSDWALIDEIEMPIVPEYAARLGQLKAGNIHRLVGTDPLGEDVMITKRDEPRIAVYETVRATPVKDIIIFGLLPEGETPFLDQRVRQAFSMAIDRDAWIDARFNVSGFEAEGLPVESYWNSHLPAIWQSPDFWLDPKGSNFGPNARYFQYNLEEARKLLEAAGYSDGFDATSSYTVERRNVAPVAEPLDGMLRDLGINITISTIDYATDYIPNFRDGQGQFEGWAYATVTGTMPQVLHPASALAAEYWPGGGTAFRGFSTSGFNDKSGDPELTAMIENARLEADAEALRAQLHDIQRHLAETMWGLMVPGGATRYKLAWPALQNYPVWITAPSVNNSIWDTHKLWIDQTQAPFA